MQSKSILSFINEADVLEKAITYRRHIHQHPELAFEEIATAEYILKVLAEAGFEEVYPGIGETGVVAVLRGQINESILIRADMDALPLNEMSDVSYKSETPNIMHACGHDGHVAMLLATAVTINEMVRNGDIVLRIGVKFCFQPAEENANNGALRMIQDTSLYNVLEEDPPVKHCFGLHLANDLGTNNIGYQSGPFTANSDRWEIHVTGKGGHCIMPEQTTDAIQIATQISNDIYQIRGRKVSQTDASTISIGQIIGGDAPNIISDKCYLTGSIRTQRDEDREIYKRELKLICDAAALKHNTQVSFVIVGGVDRVFNDQILEEITRNALKKVCTVVETSMNLGGEDFYNWSKARPSSFFLVGASINPNPDRNFNPCPHHSAIFQFNEQALLIGAKAWISLIEEFSNQENQMKNGYRD